MTIFAHCGKSLVSQRRSVEAQAGRLERVDHDWKDGSAEKARKAPRAKKGVQAIDPTVAAVGAVDRRPVCSIGWHHGLWSGARMTREVSR